MWYNKIMNDCKIKFCRGCDYDKQAEREMIAEHKRGALACLVFILVLIGASVLVALRVL